MNNPSTPKKPSSDSGAQPPRSPVPLSDGRRGLRSTMSVDVRDPAVSAPASGADVRSPGAPASLASSSDSLPSTLNSPPILDFISSDATLDRTGEIIAPSGWRLEAYRRNPVFQNAHQYGDIIFTLGKALITEVRSGPSPLSPLPSPCLYQRIQFAVEANPMARIAYALYKGKFLNAVSVGFIPIRWEDDSESSPAFSGLRRRYLEQELLEVSAVGIPANPNALALGLKSGLIEKADLRELADLIRLALDAAARPPSQLSTHFCGDPAASDTHARASGVRGNEAQLLQLARAIRNVLCN